MQYETVDCDILMDKMFVSEVCNNLIANAVRFAQTSITLSFSLQVNGLLLSVSDDGKGFDKKTVHKVTSPYFTEETERSEARGPADRCHGRRRRCPGGAVRRLRRGQRLRFGVSENQNGGQ